MRFLKPVVLTSGLVVFVAGSQQPGNMMVGPAAGQNAGGKMAPMDLMGPIPLGEMVERGPPGPPGQGPHPPRFDFTDAVKSDIRSVMDSLRTTFLNSKPVTTDLLNTVVALQAEMLANLPPAPSAEMQQLDAQIRASLAAGSPPEQSVGKRLKTLMDSFGPFTPPEVKTQLTAAMDSSVTALTAAVGTTLSIEQFQNISGGFLPPQKPPGANGPPQNGPGQNGMGPNGMGQNGMGGPPPPGKPQSADSTKTLGDIVSDMPKVWTPGMENAPRFDLTDAVKSAIKAEMDYLTDISKNGTMVAQSDVDHLSALKSQMLANLPPAPSANMTAVSQQIMGLRNSNAMVPQALTSELQQMSGKFGPFTPPELKTGMVAAMDASVTDLQAVVGQTLNETTLEAVLMGFRPPRPAGPPGMNKSGPAPMLNSTSPLVEAVGIIPNAWFTSGGDLQSQSAVSFAAARKSNGNNGNGRSNLRSTHGR
jgi:hypothetical protein